MRLTARAADLHRPNRLLDGRLPNELREVHTTLAGRSFDQSSRRVGELDAGRALGHADLQGFSFGDLQDASLCLSCSLATSTMVGRSSYRHKPLLRGRSTLGNKVNTWTSWTTLVASGL